MFYSQFILAKKGPLGTIWIAAHLERKLRRNQVADTDIGVSVDSILFPDVPIALRLSSHLLVGVVRIYSRKVNYLFHDCSEALLKIKQAFRSAAVDLPPEESTAPYHSITLPETFHLDDFELPDSAVQGDYVDHHVSTTEQITLQDNLEKTAFSTSKFGLDERFGDGNASHFGLDLEEDLLLNKDQSAMEHSSIQLPLDDDGTFQRGQSSAAPTDMDLDQNQKEFINTEKDDDLETNTDLSHWGGYNIQTPGYNIATPGYSIQTPAYNIQTPDLNEIFFSHGQGSNMEGPSVPATPFPGEEHSPETTECAPPSTPGLMEETVLARVNDASPSVNYEDAPKADSNSAPFLQPCSANGNAALNAASAGAKSGNEEGNENACESAQPVILENNADKSFLRVDAPNMNSDMSIDQFGEENLPVESSVIHKNASDMMMNLNVAAVDCTEKSFPSVDAPNMNREVSDMCIDRFGEENLPVENSVVRENASDIVNLNVAAVDSTFEALGTETSLDNREMNNLGFEQTPEQLQCKETPNSDRLADPLTASGFPEPEKVLHAPEFDTANRADELGQVTVERAMLGFDGSIGRAGSLIAQKRPLEDVNYPLTTSGFPEPEKVLQAPEFSTANRADELGQVTVERAMLEFEGSTGGISSLIGQKRPLEDVSPFYLEKSSTERASNRQRVKKSNSDFFPHDDDLLTSILAGKRTPGLRSGPTPNKSLVKRRKTTPKTGTHKRKVQLDDAMLLHADVIRQQLISTEDICRLRKKAPCTRAEIWMIEKGPLEDEIFSETLFSGATEELSELQRQTYEINISKPLRQLIRDAKGKEVETEAPKVTNEETIDAPNPGTPYAYPVDSTLINPLQDEPSTGPFYGLNNDNFVPEQQIKNNKEEVQPSDEAPTDLDKNDGTIDIIQGSCRTPLHVPEGNLLDGNSGVVHDEMDNIFEPKENASAEEGNCRTPLLVPERNLLDGNSGVVHDEMDNLFEPKENASAEVGGVENVNDLIQGDRIMQEEAFPFPGQQVGDDVNVTSVAGESSGLHENNTRDFVDKEETGHNDFISKEYSDFGSAIGGTDTDFLNADDEVDYHEEADDDTADPGDIRALDNSGWSSRTRGVARYLKLLFDEETGHGRRSVVIDHLLVGKSRKEASRMFFETLVLTTKDYIHVNQEAPFEFVNVKPGVKLMQSEF